MNITFPFFMMKAAGLVKEQQIRTKYPNAVQALIDYVERIQTAPRLVLASRTQGRSSEHTSISIQASEMHYCSPRENLHWHLYDSFELGFPTHDSTLISPYAELESDMGHISGVYNRVPRAIIQRYVDEQGGIIGYVTDPASTDYVPFSLSEEEISYYILNCS